MSDLYMSYKILESNEMHFKTCTKCGKTLPATTEYFHKAKTGKYGLNSTCKKCRSEQQKQYYENNKEKISEQYKQHYKDNKEKIAEWHKQHYKDNKEKIAERNKQWYSTPQGQVSSFNRYYRRKTKKQNQGNGINKDQWFECMRFFNWECAYSGIQLNKDNRSIDHIVPLNQGGEHEIWNCVPMYRAYNISKHDKDLLEWYQEQDFYSEERLQKIYEWQEYAYNKYSKK